MQRSATPQPGMTKPGSEAYRLHVLGTRDLRSPDGTRVSSVLAQPKRLCLLTYLAIAPGPVSRSTLAALFWPESDETRARNALSQALHYLRRSLGDDLLVSVEGDLLEVPLERLWCDARAVLRDESVSDDVLEAARRDLLEGWNAEDSQPLQEWLDTVRGEVRSRREALKTVVVPVAASGDRVHIPPSVLASRGRTTRAAIGRPGGPADAQRRSRRWPRRWAAGAAMATAAAAVLAIVSIARPSPAGPEETVVVILPRVAGRGDPATSLRDAIHDELVAHLHRPDGFRIVSASYFESIDELRRQMAALDELDQPAWVLYVTAVVIDEAAKVHGFLYHNSTFEVAQVEAFDVTLRDGRSAMLDLPPEIARRVTRMVEETLAGEKPR